MNLFAALMFSVLAQVSPPDIHPYVQAYITDDPVRADLLGLATPTGRYSISWLNLCDGLQAGQNVGIYAEASGNLVPANGYGYWVGPPNEGMMSGWRQLCLANVGARMSDIPCFTNDAGVCDAKAESDE